MLGGHEFGVEHFNPLHKRTTSPEKFLTYLVEDIKEPESSYHSISLEKEFIYGNENFYKNFFWG